MASDVHLDERLGDVIEVLVRDDMGESWVYHVEVDISPRFEAICVGRP